MSYQKLKEQLKTGDFSPCYHFFGAERYLKQYYAKAVKEKLVDAAMETFNYTVFDGVFTPDELATAIETPPMMAEKKLILLKETGIFTQGAPGKDTLRHLFESWPSYAHLIAIEEKADKRGAVYKAFAKIGLDVEFALRPRADLRAFVGKALSREQKRINGDAMDLFLDNAGNEIYGIMSHLEKLTSYVGARPIVTAADVEATLIKSFMTKEYVLTDALLAGNKSAAFSTLQELWEMQTDPIRLLMAISSTYLSVMHARALLDNGVSSAAAAAALRLPSAFLAKKLVATAGKCNAEKLTQAIRAARNTDYTIKNGQAEPMAAITALCGKLLQNAPVL